MAKSAPSTIVLKSNGAPLFDEFPLAPLDACGNGAITPGMIVELTSGEVRPHSTQGGEVSPLMVAVEGLNEDASSQTLGDIDTDYDDDNGAVKVWYPQSGEMFYGLIGPGQSVGQDGFVQSASDGYLMLYSATTPTPRRKVGQAVAAVDNSAGATPARVKVKAI